MSFFTWLLILTSIYGVGYLSFWAYDSIWGFDPEFGFDAEWEEETSGYFIMLAFWPMFLVLFPIHAINAKLAKAREKRRVRIEEEHRVRIELKEEEEQYVKTLEEEWEEQFQLHTANKSEKIREFFDVLDKKFRVHR